MATRTGYEIISAAGSGEFYGRAAGDWENDSVGLPNQFETIESAQEGIESLRALGGDWLEGTYAVREIGQRYPETGTINRPSA